MRNLAAPLLEIFAVFAEVNAAMPSAVWKLSIFTEFKCQLWIGCKPLDCT